MTTETRHTVTDAELYGEEPLPGTRAEQDAPVEGETQTDPDAPVEDEVEDDAEDDEDEDEPVDPEAEPSEGMAP